jgi:hypothetical protein
MKRKPSGDTLDRALTSLYQTDVPKALKASWRDAVKREEAKELKQIPGLAWLRRAALPAAAALVLIVGTAVTGVIAPKTEQPAPIPTETAQADYALKTAGTGDVYNFSFESDTAEDATMSMAALPRSAPYPDSESANELASEMSEAADQRKIVRTVSLTIASTAFDPDYSAILSLAEGAGGYVSSVSMYEQQVGRRAASFELRIPAGSLEGFLSGLSAVGRVTDRYETATDMTTQYTDTELRLKTQQDKMTRLQELLSKAETVEDLLAIESEIADTQYELDSLQSSLLYIDRQADYATVSVYLQEQTASDTAAAEDLTIGERLKNGLNATLTWLGGFFENMLVFLIAAAPVLIPLILGYIIYRVARKRRKTNKQP